MNNLACDHEAKSEQKLRGWNLSYEKHLEVLLRQLQVYLDEFYSFNIPEKNVLLKIFW